ncbi:MAG: acyltransferase family protein [Pirellulales bacterium]
MREPNGRIVELDALRGLAAVAVVAFHYTTRYDNLFGRATDLPWNVSWGQYGVDLFFMLSGFVIFMTLDRTQGWTRFLWGRFTRLYPAYWAAVGTTFAVVAFCGLPGQEVSLRDALLNLTMVQSLLGAEHVDGVYWSLQAEVIFYVNMVVLHRLRFFRRPFLAIVSWLAVSAIAGVMVSAIGAGTLSEAASLVNKVATIASLRYIPFFAIGILLYMWRAGRMDGWRAPLGLLLCFPLVGAYHGWESTLVAAVLATVLFLAVRGHLSWLNTPSLVFLGSLSYPLYLIHQNIGYVVMRGGEASGLGPTVSFSLAVLLAMVLAVVLHYIVERPAMARLRIRGERRATELPRFRKALALTDV